MTEHEKISVHPGMSVDAKVNALIQTFIEANAKVTLDEQLANLHGLQPHLLAVMSEEERDRYPGSVMHGLDMNRAIGQFPPRGVEISEWGLNRTDFLAVSGMPKPMQFKRMEIAFWQAVVKRKSLRSLRKLVRLGVRNFTHKELEDIYYAGVHWAAGNGIRARWRSYDGLR